MVARERGFLGAVVNPDYFVTWNGLDWHCVGSAIGLDNQDFDFSDGSIGAAVQGGEGSTVASVASNTDFVLLSSSSGQGGGSSGASSSITCRPTNLDSSNINRITVQLTASIRYAGDGTCSTSMNRAGLSNSLSCPNFPIAWVTVSKTDIVIIKSGENWIVADVAPGNQIQISTPDLAFSVATLIDSGRTTPRAIITLNDIIVECESGFEYNNAGQCIGAVTCTTLRADLGTAITGWIAGGSRAVLGTAINNWVGC